MNSEANIELKKIKGEFVTSLRAWEDKYGFAIMELEAHRTGTTDARCDWLSSMAGTFRLKCRRD